MQRRNSSWQSVAGRRQQSREAAGDSNSPLSVAGYHSPSRLPTLSGGSSPIEGGIALVRAAQYGTLNPSVTHSKSSHFWKAPSMTSRGFEGTSKYKVQREVTQKCELENVEMNLKLSSFVTMVQSFPYKWNRYVIPLLTSQTHFRDIKISLHVKGFCNAQNS